MNEINVFCQTLHFCMLQKLWLWTQTSQQMLTTLFVSTSNLPKINQTDCISQNVTRIYSSGFTLAKESRRKSIFYSSCLDKDYRCDCSKTFPCSPIGRLSKRFHFSLLLAPLQDSKFSHESTATGKNFRAFINESSWTKSTCVFFSFNLICPCMKIVWLHAFVFYSRDPSFSC